MLKEKNCQSKIWYLVKISFMDEGKNSFVCENSEVRVSKNFLLHKNNERSNKNCQIYFVKTLATSQRFAGIQEATIQQKQLNARNNSELCGLLFIN